MTKKVQAQGAKQTFEPDEAARSSARALARLLMFALIDALELGSDDAAGAIRLAIERLKREFELTEQEILRIDTRH